MSEVFRLPGLLTCENNHDWAKLYADGYRWSSAQVYNEGRRYALDTGTDFDFDACRQHGLSPGVWAVIYNVTQFHSVGKATAEIALELGADHLMMDVEECGKDTAPDGQQSIIDGVREGGWHGPVSLTTYGAPEKNPSGGYWDYAMDLFSYTDTGGFILPQAYYAPVPVSGRSPGYAAEDCVAYFCDQCGVPRAQTNLMIWPNGYNLIEVEIDDLEAAGLGPAFSVFMTETTTPEDLNALGFALGGDALPYPEPEPPPDQDTMAKLSEMAANVRAEMEQMTATSPEVWITQNPGEAGDILRLCVYRAFGQHFGARELKSHAGRAASGIAQNGVTCQDEL